MSREQQVFRDSETGRFVKESTYNRSIAHGGSRYTKETVTIGEIVIDSLDDLDQYNDYDDLIDYDYDGGAKYE